VLTIRLVIRRILALSLLIAGLLTATPLAAQAESGPVYVAPIHGPVDLGLAPYLDRVVDEARRNNARALLLDINTPGGRLDAALQLRDTVLGAPLPTIAFVNREAISAGALISLAADDIVMAPGAVLGAATPVTGQGEFADSKTISAVRSVFGATAEANRRDPLVAEAMVDPSVGVDSLVTIGELLTLTTEEASEIGYLAGVATDQQGALESVGLAGAPLQATAPSPAEALVRILTLPAVAGLLMAAGLLLVFTDLLSGGVGVLALVGVLAIGLFFWGHLLAGLAGWEGVALVILGLVLLAVELFVTPGFGVAGILSVLALLGGLFFSLIGGEVVTDAALQRAGWTVLTAFLALVAGVALIVRLLPRSRLLGGLVLQSQVGIPGRRDAPRRWRWSSGPRMEAQTSSGRGDSVTERPSLAGATGVALSPLRPGGIARINNERVDVVTRGEYIQPGEAIEVTADEGYRRVVRRHQTDAAYSNHQNS
jgi:membrane-bound serine protease (ClpP class)